MNLFLLNNGMLSVPINREQILVIIPFDSVAPINTEFNIGQVDVLNNNCITSIETITSTGVTLNLSQYIDDRIYNVIRDSDLTKFTLTLKIEDDLTPIDHLPLQSLNSDARAGKKLKFDLNHINTAKSFVKRHDPAALSTVFPFVIPLIFYYK